jgi:hypothetical protein
MYLSKAIDPKAEFEIQDRSIEYERRRKELPKEKIAFEPPPASTMPISRGL